MRIQITSTMMWLVVILHLLILVTAVPQPVKDLTEPAAVVAEPSAVRVVVYQDNPDELDVADNVENADPAHNDDLADHIPSFQLGNDEVHFINHRYARLIQRGAQFASTNWEFMDGVTRTAQRLQSLGLPSHIARTYQRWMDVRAPSGLSYAVGPLLGTGSFSDVYRAKMIIGGAKDGREVAFKFPVMHKWLKFGERELRVQQRIRQHTTPAQRRLFTLYEEAFWMTMRGRRQQLAVVMPRRDTDLVTMVVQSRQQRFPLELVQRFGQQITEALRIMHEELDLVHGDLKPDNILIDDATVQASLSDFGSTYSKEQLHNFPNHPMPISTIQYKSPEEFMHLPLNEKLDIWSLGCTLFSMATHTNLFSPLSQRRRRSTQDKFELQFLDILMKRGPPPFAMYQRMGTHHSSMHDRLVMTEEYSTPGNLRAVFFSTPAEGTLVTDADGYNVVDMLRSNVQLDELPARERDGYLALTDLIETMVQWDPEARPSAREVLGHEFFSMPLGEVRA